MPTSAPTTSPNGALNIARYEILIAYPTPNPTNTAPRIPSQAVPVAPPTSPIPKPVMAIAAASASVRQINE